ncbi:LysE/ArgO family amino acid transporter [Anaeromicrobium sediminis]|uniref:L-lysine permease n=1 Tax=Anaeromicrobium sediminis TaxID=1478221 RepID=A0A267MJP6_9FIRM|nr:LysE family transporter [Anaeromicrobium sediminis]PAB59642.1 L-lysine permease [Anaeromicrobium sediminis]
MFKYLLQGFTLGLAYVAPIGMQNLYVINTAISKSKKRAYQVALATIFFDITLALACFFGVGILIDKSILIKRIILLVGSMAVIYIGYGLIKSEPDLSGEVDLDKPLWQVISTCFVVTWLNPQAIIDGSLLLGGFRASLPPDKSNLFIIGVCIASALWFLGISTFVSHFSHLFNEKVLKKLNIVCGSIVIYYGLKLAYMCIQSIM